MKFLSLCAGILCATAALPAASVRHMSFEQVVRSSPRAVHGVVARSWSAWDDAHRAIWTHYEIRVAETLRGPARATFVVSEPGGAVGEIAMRVPGAPRLALGEEAVVFAYPTPIGYWRVRGWGQGRFRVEGPAGRRIVRAPQPEALLLRVPTKSAVSAYADGAGLEEFLDRVRNLIRPEERR